MRILRNLTRRKLRTTLTIVGITVGIWALVVMSSMANKIGALVEGGSTYYEGKIVVSDATNPPFGFGFTPMPLGTANEIQAIPAKRGSGWLPRPRGLDRSVMPPTNLTCQLRLL